MAEDQVGFEIRGRFYPFPQSFRVGDGLLITELTGQDFDRWLEGLPDDETEGDEPLSYVSLLGMVAAGIWQKHPTWRRDKVVKYLEELDLQALTWVGPEADDDEIPPDQTPADKPVGESNSSTPSESSPTTQDSLLDDTNQKPSGDPGLVIGSVSSPTT